MFSFLTNSPQWWTTSIEQYVLQILEFFRSVLAKNSAISSSASRERHICLFFVLFFKVHSGINSQAAAPGC